MISVRQVREYFQKVLTPVGMFIWRHMRPDLRFFVYAVICSVVVSSTSFLPGLAGKFLINLMSSHAHRGLSHHDLIQLDLLSFAFVVMYAVRWPFVYFQSVCFAESGARLGLRLRNAVYEHLQSLSLGYYTRQRTGALMSTINNDVPILQGSIASLRDIAQAPVTIVTGLAIVFTISPLLSLVAIVATPLIACTINALSRRIRRITAETQDKLADVNTQMEETLSAVRIIQSFSAETYEIGRFKSVNQQAKDLGMSAVRQASRIKPAVDLIGASGIALALWVGGYLVINGNLTLGELAFFVLSLNQVANGFTSMSGARVTWEQMQAAGSRIMENVLDVKSDVCDAPNAVELPSVSGRIEFERVHFAYNPQTPILRDISFTMEPGDVVALVGMSGAGKSTIADLIPRFYDPQCGRVSIDGLDIRGVSIASLRRHIGIVPQETLLFHGTIRDNISYGARTATDKMIEDAARAANAHSFIMELPARYDTIVGERGKDLSGGERQRIAIARALLKNPRILILDEATSSLDAESQFLVQEALDKLMQGRTTLVIAHRLATIQNANKILVVEAGRIVESGTHDELVRRDGAYSRYYALQVLRGADLDSTPTVRSDSGPATVVIGAPS